jgi:hypothetical protein
MATRSVGEVPQVLRALAKFAGIFALIWLGIYQFRNSYPYYQAGADVVFQIKERWERTPHLFKKPDAAGVLFFGNSKVLAGIVPDQFDAAMEASGRPTESYNLGLPADNYFVDRLESILAAGNVPKYIIITVPWVSDGAPINLFHFIRHDSQVMNELFPFRMLARDMLTTALTSVRATGSFHYYDANRRRSERMLADAGYFFVYDTSYYPNDQLPPNFRSSFDRPDFLYLRRATTRESEFHKLNHLLETYDVTCLMVPLYFRAGQFAQAPRVNERLQLELARFPRVRLLGPDYLLYDNRYFSDPAHLNREGARVYTRYLADLLAPNMR